MDIKLILNVIISGLILFISSNQLWAQDVITSDSMETKLRHIPDAIFEEIKKEERDSPANFVVSEASQGKVHTIPAATEDNTVKLLISNTTKWSISDLNIKVEKMPRWLNVETNTQKINQLKAGDIIEVSYKFRVASEISSNKKTDIIFEITGSNGFSGQKTIQVVSGEPLNFKLNKNYPNPFNKSTNISYRLPEQMQVKVTVYNILGRKVAVLADGVQTAGTQALKWNASRYASGVYFYRIVAEGQSGKRFIRDKKMLLIK